MHALLATGAVHHRLVDKGLRCKCNLLVETGTARDAHHFACLIGYGATAVYPYMAYQTLFDMMRKGRVKVDTHERLGLGRSYRRGGEEIRVLAGLDLDVGRGEFVAFMGPSGSGKSTLLNLLGGLDQPSAGSILVAGEDITRFSARELTAWRARHVGFVFQMYNLIPVLTAQQNVELPLLLTKLSKAERRRHVEAALSLVGLSDRMSYYPGQLSGGQAQRVAIARAVVTDPKFLLCDEPTGDLDRKTAHEIMDLIHDLSKQYGKTVLMVTHDPLAAEHADVVLHLDKGVLVEASAVGGRP